MPPSDPELMLVSITRYDGVMVRYMRSRRWSMPPFFDIAPSAFTTNLPKFVGSVTGALPYDRIIRINKSFVDPQRAKL